MDANYQYSGSEEIDETEDVFMRKCFYNKKYAIKLPVQAYKKSTQRIVSSVNLAHNLTFLLQTGAKTIQYFTRDGNLIYEKEFSKLITAIVMADCKNTIILLRSMNQESEEIVTLNLETYQIFCLPFLKQLKGFCEMLTFPQSKMICIKENDGQSIKLAYYKYENKQQIGIQIQEHPIYLTYFNYESDQLNKKHKIIKLNNKSMIGIFRQKPQKQDKVDIFIYDPEKDEKNIRKYTFSGSLKIKSPLLFNVIDVWEYEPDILLVKYQSYPQNFQRGEPLPSTQEEMIIKMQKYYEFLWQYKDKKSKKSIKLLKMIPNRIHYTHLRGQQLNLILQVNLKDYIHQSREIRTQKKSQYAYYYDYYHYDDEWYYQPDQYALDKWIEKQPQQYQIPIYFVNSLNRSETAVELEKFQTHEKQSKRLVSVPYNPSFFLQFWEQLGTGHDKRVLNVTLKIMKELKYSSKIITAFFVTEIMEKCDEDLLYYASNLIQQAEDEMSFHRFD